MANILFKLCFCTLDNEIYKGIYFSSKNGKICTFLFTYELNKTADESKCSCIYTKVIQK